MLAVATAIDSGQLVGRYQPIRRLAVGGMAEIFLARVPGLGIEGFEKLVVLKRILPQHALDPELLRMFLDEARLSATLTHPHVIEVYDVGAVGDAPFFSMEYVHGANVREMLRAQARAAGNVGSVGKGTAPLPLAHAIAIVAAAASGLNYAHERLGPGGEPLGIVHRDVSPSNVLVSYDGAVKVSDFGIAKWAFQRTRTQEGTLKGKFAYMSPEQCRARPVDRRSDIFALGAILYELTTGAPPFGGASELDILNQIATGRAAAPAWPEAMGTYPPALSEIVLRALAPEPDDRFQTMQELQIALESFARASDVALSTVALASYVQELFAEELAAWRAAQREGKSLGDHLAAKPTTAASADPGERTATDAFGTTAQHAKKRARVVRDAALVGFLLLCGGAGALITKHWRGAADAAPAADRATAAKEIDPRSVAPGAERIPATQPTAEKHLARAANPSTTATTTSAKTKARMKPAVLRTANETTARPTAESRLGAWDPDSPVPP
ncbi:MAG TPA: serine/threonine-protein kinase [Polyangia bacterium]|nr:serine/threonine-protein kinase [Polyangia bacterium]